MKLTVGKIKEKNKAGVKEVTITLESDLVMKNSNQIKEDLSRALSNGDVFYINSKEMSVVDLSGLQLIIALYAHAQILGKKMVVDLNFSQEANAVLEHVGFTTILNKYKN